MQVQQDDYFQIYTDLQSSPQKRLSPCIWSRRHCVRHMDQEILAVVLAQQWVQVHQDDYLQAHADLRSSPQKRPSECI